MNLFVRASQSERSANFRTRLFGTRALRTRRFGSQAALLIALLAALAAPAATAPTASASPSCPWLNQSLPVGQRVQLLMSQMTLANKINMVTGAGFSEPYVFYISGIPSLCVPPMGQEDGPLGVGDGLTGVTQMPAAVSLAATFDPSLADQYGQVVGTEERGKGAMVNLGPTVNIDRDPRWGRSFEAFTEDPFLNGKMAVSEIDGVQSQDEMSQVKHLAVYNQETNRNTRGRQRDRQSARAARDLPAGVLGRDRAGQGVVGDVRLQHDQRRVRLPEPVPDADHARSALGIPRVRDLRLPGHALDRPVGRRGHGPGDARASVLRLRAADRRSGWARSAWATLDQMVRRILVEMFRFNEFNNPPTGSTSATVTTPAHQAVSTAVAEAGTVLLKNDRDTLPLRSTGKSPIAVIGPAASASPTDTGGGSAYVTSPFNVTPLQGIQAAAASRHDGQLRTGAPDRHLAVTDPEQRPQPGVLRRRATAAATPAR